MRSDPGPGSPHTGGNDDEVWRELVSRLEDGGTGRDGWVGDGGASDGGASDADGDPLSKGVLDFDPLGVWQQQSQGPAADEEELSTAGPRDYAASGDGDEFVPEELPSLRTTEPAIMLSWIGAAGGPLFLVFSAIFWRQIPMMLVIAVFIAFLAGTGYLLFRLPAQRDGDSGDGAVV